MRDLQKDVFKFHREVLGMHTRSGQVPGTPRAIENATAQLSRRLIREEANELIDALEDQNLAEIADGACDLIYVSIGACLRQGIYLPPFWDEVQRTNMAKKGGTVRSDGKLLKPGGWEPPNMIKLIREQQMGGIYLPARLMEEE